ncbi:MAG TPA: SAM-dependent methyltransferase [Kofleriaceae bacterium]|jgi:methyltransferase (TIGR00027 family)|nr:SAM-dependent methyltransferase [Kofleriaceae bacterium]
MREDTPSRTAQWVAAARGMGMLLPADQRIADDPYGLAFASPTLARMLDERRPRALAHLPFFKHWVAYMQVRTRLLDDAARAFVASGGRQIVLLGAGFDCRALRLHELDESTVFEVDHPATQHHKQATLRRIGAESPARYVTWDFEARPLDELTGALADAGHDRAAPTLTIWEGVTMYLTEPAIDASLRAIADWSSGRSQLAMTYFDRSRLDKPSLVTRAVQAAVAQLGEPFKWGWKPEQLPGYLAPRGWLVQRDVSIREAAQELLAPQLARTIGRADSRIAFAVASERVALVQQ